MGVTAKENVGGLKPAARTAPDTALPPPVALPDQPVVVVEVKSPWGALDLGELWAYRELLYFLTWRDVKVRYKQTALGVAWVVMQPLLSTAVFTLFLGRLAGVPSDGAPYALFAFAGLVPWTFFNGAVTSSSNSLVGNSHLITKIYFPRGIIPVAAVAARLPDFAVAFAFLAALTLFWGAAPGWGLLMLPVCVALLALLALGLGMATSALNVRYRDVGVMMPLLLQLWMFASPVVYPASLVPEAWQKLYALNPLVGLIGGFRAALLGGEQDWAALGVAAGVTLALLACAAFLFRRMESHFADVV
jgi:lipopolysaccharide transport system permease protein